MSELRFGPVNVQPDQRRVLVNGKPAPLGARAFDVLVALAERSGRLVSKAELLDLAWPGVVVEENNLQVQISALRKALGADAIATIPGRGYRFTLLRDEAASGSPGPHLDSSPNEPNALYGRQADFDAILELIRRHRLVTVAGPAGIGKTRLARAVAHAAGPEFEQAVCVVDLAPITDAALVPTSVASALGLATPDTAAASDTIVRTLSGQRLLLVLDNCEHLGEAVDTLVDALRRGAPHTHVLVTSQELLRHPDEQVYRLGALTVPDRPTLDAARTAGAVELFVARAQAVERRFELDASNVEAIVEICRRLDGIPLAIELAAARVPLIGVGGVRERLDERFRLLTAGSRLALRRHQTLRAALDWSYGLLSEDERAVFDLLGVFAGTFSLECAQALAADARMDAWTVLEHLGALVDKSLVVVEGVERPRYRLLETMRAFALEHLAMRGATPRAMRRHAEVMLELFQRYRRNEFEGPPTIKAAAADALAPDHDNLRQALRWAAHADGDARIAVGLVAAAGSTMGYLRHVALRAEAWDLCNAVRPLVDDSIEPADAAAFWLACAEHGVEIAIDVAAEDAKRALALYRELGNRRGRYLACKTIAHASLLAGDGEAARKAIAEALALRDPAWPTWLVALADNVAALVYANVGERALARRHADVYLATARAMCATREIRGAVAIVADLDLVDGDTAAAVAAVSDELARYPVSLDGQWTKSSERSTDGISVRIFASVMACAGRLDDAERLYRVALSRTRRSFGNAAYVLIDAGLYLALRGRVDDSARVLAYAETAYGRSGRRPRPTALMLRERLMALLAGSRSADELHALFDQGRGLTDDEACEIAFPTDRRA